MLEIDENIENQISYAADFIKGALEESPEYFELDTEDEDKEPLTLDKNLNQLSFQEIPPLVKNKKIAAVDGGSAMVVKTRSFVIGVHRCGYTVFQGKKRIREKIIPLSLETISFEGVKNRYSNTYSEIMGEMPTEFPELNRILDRVRTLYEWKLADEALTELGAGDLLLIDGSLRASISTPYNLLLKITEKAEMKKIHLVGVTKTSTLYWGKRSPLIPMVIKLGKKFSPSSQWFCKLSDINQELENPNWFGIIYVARLNPVSDFGFRVDVNRLDRTDPKEIFSTLAEVSSDPAFLGYPYPLAAIHNLVRIMPGEISDIRYRLQSKALEKGISTADWDLLFTDFHDVLNADLNR